MKAHERQDLIQTLRQRFEQHPERHQGIAWDGVQARPEANPAALEALGRMEETGGEPDVIGQDGKTGRFTFCDCAPESPAGRRSLCYGRVFTYHNGAQSYYAVRGFRGWIGV